MSFSANHSTLKSHAVLFTGAGSLTRFSCAAFAVRGFRNFVTTVKLLCVILVILTVYCTKLAGNVLYSEVRFFQERVHLPTILERFRCVKRTGTSFI